MPEAVIVATARSPIGRAVKGSLKDMRPDDLAVQMVQAALAKVPGARPDRDRRPDARLRTAGRRVRQQPRPGRCRARGPRPPARHHREPLLLLEPADHPDGAARDQGRRGRRLHLRRCRDRQPLRQGQRRRPARHPEPALRRGPGPHRDVRRRRPDLGRPARPRASCPTSTSPWARPRRTSPSSRASPARSRTRSASAARTSPRRRSPMASGAATSPRSPCPTAPWSAPTTARAPASRSRRSPRSSRSSAPTAR